MTICSNHIRPEQQVMCEAEELQFTRPFTDMETQPNKILEGIYLMVHQPAMKLFIHINLKWLKYQTRREKTLHSEWLNNGWIIGTVWYKKQLKTINWELVE